MGPDDEFRKVAEDVRELARTLRSELRTVRREAQDAARKTQRNVRDQYRSQVRGGPYRGGPYWRSNGHGDTSDRGWQGPPRRPDREPRSGGGAPPSWPAPPAPVERASKPPAPPIRHRRDGSTLLSLLLVLIGLAWLSSQFHIVDLPLEGVLAVALVLLGAGMVVTARTDWALSRRGWPVWLGAALLVVLLVDTKTNTAGLGSFSVGNQAAAPLMWTDAATTVSTAAGNDEVDLTHLAPGAGALDETMTVRTTFGNVDITVPRSAGFRVQVNAHSQAGNVSLDGVPAANGIDATRVARFGTTGPLLTVDASTVAGNVTVTSQ